VSSDVTSVPTASNVNYSPGSVDPNVALAPIGADGRVCFVNSELTSVHLIADHAGTINAAAYRVLGPTVSGAQQRLIDTVTVRRCQLAPSARRCFDG
jgi:hypothetical protein